jgi:hypothetical protein
VFGHRDGVPVTGGGGCVLAGNLGVEDEGCNAAPRGVEVRVRIMSWICSGVSDATSAAKADGLIAGGAILGAAIGGDCDWGNIGTDEESDESCGNSEEIAETGGAGGGGGVATSLPLLRTQTPTRRSYDLVEGIFILSNISMNSGSASVALSGMIYSSFPG